MKSLKNMTEADFAAAHGTSYSDGIPSDFAETYPVCCNGNCNQGRTCPLLVQRFPDGDAGEPLDAEDLAFITRVCWCVGACSVAIITCIVWAVA